MKNKLHSIQYKENINKQKKNIIIHFKWTIYQNGTIYSFKSHKLAMIDFILNFIVFLFRLKKNHFNDHLPFYCER